MIIALDFDNTFTADQKLLSAVVEQAFNRGHRVICVSACPPTDWCIRHRLTQLPQGVGLLCSWGCKKRRFMRELGLTVGIWIDDTPDMIVGEEVWQPSEDDLVKHELSLESWRERAAVAWYLTGAYRSDLSHAAVAT